MKLFILSALLMLSFGASAQVVTGSIRDDSGAVLQDAVAYIEETKQAIIVDSKGAFKVQLDSGTYNFVFIQPEHAQERVQIKLEVNDTISTQIILQKKDLNQELSQSNNDIRDSIIYKLKKRTDEVTNYNPYSYVRGELIIEEVSSVMDKLRMLVENKKLSDLKNVVIGQEIYSKIDNINTDSVHLSILAEKGHIPNRWNNMRILDLLSSSLYQDKFIGKISPLNLKTIIYYNFIYQGSYFNDYKMIHKVKFESSIKDSELLEGYLYFDDTWDLYFADLILSKKRTDQRILISYYGIYDTEYLPISIYSKNKLDLAGTKIDLQYKAYMIYDEPLAQKLLGEITFDETQATLTESQWDKLRTYQNLDNELNMKIFIQKDKYVISNYTLGRILFGDYALGNRASKWSIKYGGVKMIFRDYNYVDGLWLGQNFDIKNIINENQSLDINPYIYYTTARKRVIGGTDFLYHYDENRSGTLITSVGSKSVDFNSLTTTRYQNYFSSLIMGENSNFFYQMDYASVTNNINLSSHLKGSVSLGVEKRHGLSNNTKFSVFKQGKIKPNIYPDDRFDQTYYSIGLSYSPHKIYNTSDALEVYEKKITPIVNLDYIEGFSSWQKNNSKYRKLEVGILHNIEADYFNEIGIKLEGGVFLDDHGSIHPADFEYFGASDMLVNLNSFFDSFLLLDNYELNTNKYWINTFLNYSGKYFLLKRIPFLQRKNFSENIHLKTLYTPNVDLYSEFGYSITYNRYIGVGGFVSMSNTQVQKVGIRLSLNLRSFGLSL